MDLPGSGISQEQGRGLRLVAQGPACQALGPTSAHESGGTEVLRVPSGPSTDSCWQPMTGKPVPVCMK